MLRRETHCRYVAASLLRTLQPFESLDCNGAQGLPEAAFRAGGPESGSKLCIRSQGRRLLPLFYGFAPLTLALVRASE